MNGGFWGRALDTFIELGCHSMDILIFRYLAFKVNGLQIWIISDLLQLIS
jgi:hypothetical protein